MPNPLPEIWRDVIGYEGLYQVSSLGRVRSYDRKVRSRYGNLRTIKGRILKILKIWSGYGYVRLSRGRVSKHHSIHRLVATTFIPNPSNLPCVNHKDENKFNNCVTNLEWCNWRYNANYGTRNTRVSQRRRNLESISKPVSQYSKSGELICEYPSAKEAERITGINNANIISCCIGRLHCHSAGGYIWKYGNKN